MNEVTHIRIPAWIKEAARLCGRQEQRGINDQLIYWMRTGMPTTYEVLKLQYDELVRSGQSAPPGIKAQKFREAEAIRERMDAMSVEDAEKRI